MTIEHFGEVPIPTPAPQTPGRSGAPKASSRPEDAGSPAHGEWLLDEALLETFPASDPISPSSPRP